MTEYIKREDVLKILSEKNAPWNVYVNCKELPAEDVQPMRWISVTESLPNQEEDVLVFYEWVGESETKYREMDIMTLKEADYRENKIIAWMSLPEPPKDGEEDV